MPMIIVVPFKPVPDGATEEQRRAMLAEWEEEMRRANPQYYRADGSLKSFGQVVSGLFGW